MGDPVFEAFCADGLWPGLGRTVVEAVFSRDYPVVQAGVLVTSILFVLSNFLVDLSYGLIDPRIRL